MLPEPHENREPGEDGGTIDPLADEPETQRPSAKRIMPQPHPDSNDGADGCAIPLDGGPATQEPSRRRTVPGPQLGDDGGTVVPDGADGEFGADGATAMLEGEPGTQRDPSKCEPRGQTTEPVEAGRLMQNRPNLI